MDGFVSNEGVIVLGATNMRDHLDKALLRPGRFDNQVEVGKPDVKGRREILGLYMSKIKHDDSIDVESIASRTTGFAGADLQVGCTFFDIYCYLDLRKVNIFFFSTATGELRNYPCSN